MNRSIAVRSSRARRAFAAGMLGLACGALVSAPRVAQEAAADPGTELLAGTPRFELPPGPAAEAVARVTAETVPAVIPGDPWPDWGVRDASGWGAPDPWRRWAELVRAEARAERPDPVRRAQLALCARAQGRDRDAWDHLAAVGARADLVAALLPRFLPGVTTRPGESTSDASGGAAGIVWTGGLPGGLRSGDLLRPPLPPALDPTLARSRAIWAPTLRHAGFAVGEARVSFALELSEDGVEISILHLSGPPVELTFVLPAPRSQTIRSVYANWERVEDPGAPVTLRVSPQEPEGEIWGKFWPRTARWPEALPDGADARVVAGAMRLVGDEGDAFLAGLAAGLSTLLDTDCRLVAPGTPPTSFREPLAIRLGDGPDDEAKLLSLLSRAEVYALRGPAHVEAGAPARPADR